MTKDQINEAAMLAGLHRVPLHRASAAQWSEGDPFERLAELIAAVRARAVEDAARALVERDAALREVAREVCREFGFKEPAR